MQTGLLYAALAFGTWGLFPLYFMLIPNVGPLEMVLHRSVWSLLFVLMILAVHRHWSWLGEVLRRPRRLALFMLTAALVSVNWLTYVYAQQTGHVVDASLGYFINPLVSVLLGVVALKERLRPLQWLAVALAACGVAWLTWRAGGLPWIALVVACSFGLYGLLRKTAPLGALEGLALENMLLAPIVLPALAWYTASRGGVLAQGPASQMGLLLLAGPLTALPLLWFNAAARRLPLATLGMVQYLSPSLQLILGVWLFHEPFGSARAVGFGFIWAGLVLVSVDALGLGPRAPLSLARLRRPEPAPPR